MIEIIFKKLPDALKKKALAEKKKKWAKRACAHAGMFGQTKIGEP